MTVGGGGSRPIAILDLSIEDMSQEQDTHWNHVEARKLQHEIFGMPSREKLRGSRSE